MARPQLLTARLRLLRSFVQCPLEVVHAFRELLFCAGKIAHGGLLQLDRFSKTFIETAAVQDVAGSDVTVGRLLVGYSLKLPSGASLNLAVGIGTTGDASDTDLRFRLPFTFGD